MTNTTHTANEIDLSTLDQVVGGAEASTDLRRKQEQEDKVAGAVMVPDRTGR